MKHRLLFACISLLSAVCLMISTESFVCMKAFASSADYSQNNDITWPSGPSITSETAIVMELSTGTILYEKNATMASYPASITKIMTALLAVENSSMDEMVSFTRNAVYGNDTNSSSIGMQVGEELTMEECMYGMMLASANEVAKAIAEHVGGSLENFADMMNERAAELGCVNTHFVNPSGLHDDNHYTCAYDMALIAQAAIRNSTFKKISGTRIYVIPPTNLVDEERWVSHHHHMINPSKYPRFAYSACYAGKNGYTNMARNTLVSYAKKDNLDIVCVVMRAPSYVEQYEDSITLLDYAFDNFTVHSISKLDNAPSFDNFSLFTRFSPLFNMEQSPLSIDTNSIVVLPNGASYSDIEQTITYLELEKIEKGSNIIGQVSYQYGNKLVGFTDILYESETSISLLPEDTNIPSEASEADSGSTSNTSSSDMQEEQNSKKSMKPFIIVGILLFLAVIALIYYVLVELPHRRKRRAFYEKRKKRRMQDSSYLDL